MNKSNLSFEKNSILLFIFSIAGSALNYLFQIISGQLLTTSQYGDLNTLFSVFNIATVFGTSMALSIANISAGKTQNILKYTTKIFKTIFACSLIPAIVFAFLLVLFLKVSPTTSIITTISIVMTILTYIYYGALQGRKAFISVGVLGFIPPFFKAVVGTAIMFIFIKATTILSPISAVFISLIISSIFSIVLGYIGLKKHEIYDSDCDINIEYKKTFSFLKFCLVSSICLVIFNNVDVLIIRFFFDQATVGLYSSALLFGKIILYIPAALVTVMVPSVAENKKDKTTLLKTLGYSVGLALVASLGVLVFKEFAITLLMGEKYLEATEFILPICLMVIPLVAITVLINYLLASGKEFFVSVCCIIAIIMILILVAFFNSSVSVILASITVVYSCLLIVLISKAFITNKLKSFHMR